MPEQPNRKPFAREGVLQLLAFTFLIGDEHDSPAGIRQSNAAAFENIEIAWRELAPIDQGEDQPVGEPGAELFDEIQRKARSSRPVAM